MRGGGGGGRLGMDTERSQLSGYEYHSCHKSGNSFSEKKKSKRGNHTEEKKREFVYISP